MARMVPARFDASTNSSAERRLYEALARQMDDEWAVLHHVMWIGDDEFGRPLTVRRLCRSTSVQRRARSRGQGRAYPLR